MLDWLERAFIRLFGRRANMADHGVEVKTDAEVECWIWRGNVYVWTK